MNGIKQERIVPEVGKLPLHEMEFQCSNCDYIDIYTYKDCGADRKHINRVWCKRCGDAMKDTDLKSVKITRELTVKEIEELYNVKVVP